MSISQNFPNTRPSLNLNFARSKTLDPRITFTRTSTGTYVDESGFIRDAAADEPRFDHDPVTGECLGLLIEEQRANLCTQSSNFNFSATNNITETDVFNPDGTAALRRVPLSTGNFHGTGSDAANIDISGLADGATTSVTTSIFVKNYNNSNLRLLIGFAAYDGTTYRYLLGTINTANPTFLATPSATGWSNGSTKVENYGNGWYRYSFSGTYTKATGYHSVVFVGEQILSSTGQQFWFGDDVSGIYIWGKQREVGLFSTSYIPTSGSTVTRTPDNASITGSNFSDFYNQSEGTFYSQFKGESRAGSTGYVTKIVYSISDGSFNNSHYGVTPESNGDMYWYSVSSGAGQGLLGITPLQPFASNVVYKSAYAIKTNDRALSINGYIDTDSTTTLPVVNRLYIGSSWNGASLYFGGHISQLTYYPVRLSNSQLQTLTK